jgi:hypothetical protein
VSITSHQKHRLAKSEIIGATEMSAEIETKKQKTVTVKVLLGGLLVVAPIIYFVAGLLFSWNVGLILVGTLCLILAFGPSTVSARIVAVILTCIAISNISYFGNSLLNDPSAPLIVMAKEKREAEIQEKNRKDEKERLAYQEKLKAEEIAASEKLAAIEAEEIAKTAEEKQMKLEEKQAAADLERKQTSGELCESAWDGSVPNVIYAVKNTLRNPASFEHINTYVKAVDSKGLNEVTMSYRAQNGFGGMNEVFMVAKIRNSDCEVVEIY